jgi:hypothetical protein
MDQEEDSLRRPGAHQDRQANHMSSRISVTICSLWSVVVALISYLARYDKAVLSTVPLSSEGLWYCVCQGGAV